MSRPQNWSTTQYQIQMTKTNKELKLNMSLTEFLSRYTKDELVKMADLMGLVVPDSDDVRKDELIEDVEDHIRYGADDVLDRSSVFELEFLQKLMLPESRYGIVSVNNDALLPLTKMGGIISCPHPLGVDYAIYMMLDEVRDYFEPHLAKTIARKKELGFDRLEQLTMGTLNLFGGMTVKALIAHIEGIADRSDLLIWRNVGSYLLNHTLFGTRRIFHISPKGEQDCFFATPLLTDETDVKRIFNHVVWDNPMHSYTAYGQKWVMEYGRMPFPHIMAPSMDRLYDLMVNKAEKPMTEQNAEMMLTKLWLAHETSQTKEQVELMSDIMLRIDVKDAETDDSQVSDALAMTFRDLPEWHLDGKTMDDLLKPLPKLSAPQHTPMTQPPTHKLGRNEPCWCGSGRKYKHCHGKFK